MVRYAVAETPVQITNPEAGLVCTATVVFDEEEHPLLAYVFTLAGPRGTRTLVFRPTAVATMPAVLLSEVSGGTGPPRAQPFGSQPVAVFGTAGTFAMGPDGSLELSAGPHPFLVGANIQDVLRAIATDFRREAFGPDLQLTGNPPEGAPA